MNSLHRIGRGLAFLVRGGTLAIAANLSLAVLSLALALSLWLYVTERENPQQTDTFNSAIQIQFVNVPDGLALSNASASSVRIQIAAPKNQISGLKPNDFQATVNLGGLEKGTTSLPVDVTSSSGSVNVTDVTPSRVDVTVEPVRTKQVPVKINLVGSPQLGFSAGDQSVNPSTATVTGPESLVGLVDSAVADANIAGLRVDFSSSVALVPRDVRGGDISRITVAPEKVDVSVKMVQRQFSSGFVVSPDIQGAPASGYNVVSVSVEPSLVTLRGPAETLQNIDAVAGVQTDEISIADQRTDVVRQVGLQLPDGITIDGADTVTVRIAIAAARGEQTYSVVPQVKNVGDNLAVTLPGGAVSVTLSGDVPTLQALNPGSITVTVDANGLGPGLHTLPITVQAPTGTTVVRTDPGEFGIALSKRQ
ncbi:MAG TPA: CdaR family protein [Dehalococcoidia bacterium]|nr:CdaR family protein [Dehalococcoidia bacterium]